MTDPYQQIIDTLSRCKRVLITTHVRPDGDALGTTAALAMALRHQNIASRVLLLSHVPTKYAFVYHDNDIEHLDVEKGWPGEGNDEVGMMSDERKSSPNSSFIAPRSSLFDSFDALLVADTGTWSQLPGLRERLVNFTKPKIVLDHHLTQEEWADVKLVIPEAAAAGEIAAELLEQWRVPLTKPIATALFLAIASDTGWFQFSNTRPFTMRLAATLMEAGVDTDEMYQHLYQSERPQRVALQTRAMQSLQLLNDNRLAVMTVTKDDFAATGAGVPATENLINTPLQIQSVEVSLLFVEPPETEGEGGPIRVSLRSKGQIDVAKFAEQFGGGGHARAAGLKIATSLDSAREQVVAAMLQRLHA